MKFSTFLSGAALVASSAALDPITIKGSKFFYKNGTEFFIRGVAYQQEMSSSGTTTAANKYKDPLSDADACKRDVPLLQELRTNTIRTYAIDPEADHSACMKLLSEAGIYVVSDLSEPSTSIIRSDPKWNDDLYERYTAVIDELAQYDNVLGFFAGNEVSNNKSNTDASAFVKAAVRDMKSYIKRKNYRPMGVGYATNDDAAIREDMATYFNCGDSRDETIDFWGYNIYSWCGDSSFEDSGYDKVVEEFKDYGVPVFFAEYGCNNVKPRKFSDVPVLFGPKMTGVVSGGIVYMYFQEANQYGLVKVDGDKAEKLTDFNNLKEQMEKVNPTGVTMDEYNPSNTKPETCPSSDNWQASQKLPPTPNKDLCSCMKKSLKCVTKDSISDKQVGELFGTVCGMKGAEDVCDGINSDATKGVYGAYSMCSPSEMLSWAMNAYYEKMGESDTACDFDGSAQTQSATEPSGDCSSLMDEAGDDGTGQVTSQPSTDGTTGGDGGSETSSSAAFPTAIPAFNFGILSLGAYVVCGVMAGASIILM